MNARRWPAYSAVALFAVGVGCLAALSLNQPDPAAASRRQAQVRSPSQQTVTTPARDAQSAHRPSRQS
jgi:hypothetical protein